MVSFVQLAEAASNFGDTAAVFQNGYALLSELGDLLADLESSVLRLPVHLGNEPRCKAALDELQALLGNVAQYRAEAEDTRCHLEAALSELVQSSGDPSGEASPSGSIAGVTAQTAAMAASPGVAAPPDLSLSAPQPQAQPPQRQEPGGPHGEVLDRVRRVICSLGLDVDMAEVSREGLDAELLALREQMRQELRQQQAQQQQQQEEEDSEGEEEQARFGVAMVLTGIAEEPEEEAAEEEGQGLEAVMSAWQALARQSAPAGTGAQGVAQEEREPTRSRVERKGSRRARHGPGGPEDPFDHGRSSVGGRTSASGRISASGSSNYASCVSSPSSASPPGRISAAGNGYVPVEDGEQLAAAAAAAAVAPGAVGAAGLVSAGAGAGAAAAATQSAAHGAALQAAQHARVARLHAARHVSRRLAAQHLARMKEQHRQRQQHVQQQLDPGQGLQLQPQQRAGGLQPLQILRPLAAPAAPPPPLMLAPLRESDEPAARRRKTGGQQLTDEELMAVLMEGGGAPVAAAAAAAAALDAAAGTATTLPDATAQLVSMATSSALTTAGDSSSEADSDEEEDGDNDMSGPGRAAAAAALASPAAVPAAPAAKALLATTSAPGEEATAVAAAATAELRLRRRSSVSSLRRTLSMDAVEEGAGLEDEEGEEAGFAEQLPELSLGSEGGGGLGGGLHEAASVAALRRLNRVTRLAGMWEAGGPVAPAPEDSGVAAGLAGHPAAAESDAESARAKVSAGGAAAACPVVPAAAAAGEAPCQPALRRHVPDLPDLPPLPGCGGGGGGILGRALPAVQGGGAASPFLLLAMQGRAPEAPPPPVLGRLLCPLPAAPQPQQQPQAEEEEAPASPAGRRVRRGSGGGAFMSPRAAAIAHRFNMAAGVGAAAPAPLPMPEASVHLRAVGPPAWLGPSPAAGPLGPPGWGLGLAGELDAALQQQQHLLAQQLGALAGLAGGGGAVAGGGGAGEGGAGAAAPVLDFGPDVPTLDLHKDISGWGACLGRGAFGAVYKAMWRNRPVAVKVLHGGALDARDLRALRTEICLLAAPRLRSAPNIISVHGAAATPFGDVALVTELMDCDLYDYIHRRRQNCVPMDEVLLIARSIAAGLAALHPAIVHRDLKPANVLLRHSAVGAKEGAAGAKEGAGAAGAAGPAGAGGSRLVVKIADFGLARHKRSQYLSTRERNAGTLKYLAPECIANGAASRSGSASLSGPQQGDQQQQQPGWCDGELGGCVSSLAGNNNNNNGGGGGGNGNCSGITEKCDIYSFGVLLFELITGKEPWEGCHPLYAICQVQSGAVLPVPDDPRRCPPALRALVLRCLAYRHTCRPSSAELVAELDAFIEQHAQGLPLQGRAAQPVQRVPAPAPAGAGATTPPPLQLQPGLPAEQQHPPSLPSPVGSAQPCDPSHSQHCNNINNNPHHLDHHHLDHQLHRPVRHKDGCRHAGGGGGVGGGLVEPQEGASTESEWGDAERCCGGF
ncbi:hypothetical protein CHLRE_10g464550v5 [Chlamydomonas reinhardtii]|uniref:Protein kinase domain-containing protein n=1 Tax=Chlamydomonas reinhardtii TaxID=3055 RepID=A0A2K3DC55_CHLRE|nr:uncharacterized protein CHLRE_10g464550v5 [Chlamydomonas reinhardtii]PNW78109.1 hypothetical protein CHLRE_10g464550v5 [Chlamydomonas reinhardtii]